MNAPVNSIESITISGFASIKHARLELSPDVTVLIGANGAGKSNIIRGFELAAHIMIRRLQSYVLARGGLSTLLHTSQDGRGSSIELAIQFHPDDNSIAHGYIASIKGTDTDQAYIEEWLTQHNKTQPTKPHCEQLPAGYETSLTSLDGQLEHFAGDVQTLLAGIRVFHFDEVGSQAPPKMYAPVSDNVNLHPDASNIGAYLMRLKAEFPEDYSAVVSAVKNVAPFFDDFILVPEGPDHESVRLRWRQKDLDTVFNAAQLSDGTMRFICLATLLLSPHRPQCTVLDEPELGLHPHAIVQLAALLRKAAYGHRQCVVATQSTLLLDEFTVDNVVVLNREQGLTTLVKPSPDQLESFLNDYSLGEMWRMNLLGGSPSFGEAL